MPQLDKFTYFTQFFWLCLILFTFYIAICNDGVLGISRILKLRNRLTSHRGNKIRSKDPYECALESEAISKKGFRTGLSYMYSSLFEVSQWCKQVEKSEDFWLCKKLVKSTLISSFGEISGSRGLERKILLYLISKSSYQTSSITIPFCGNEITLIHLLHTAKEAFAVKVSTSKFHYTGIGQSFRIKPD